MWFFMSLYIIISNFSRVSIIKLFLSIIYNYSIYVKDVLFLVPIEDFSFLGGVLVWINQSIQVVKLDGLKNRV